MNTRHHNAVNSSQYQDEATTRQSRVMSNPIKVAARYWRAAINSQAKHWKPKS